MRSNDRHASAGFTLLEILIVVTILATISAIAVPQYLAALRTARVGKARMELKTIATAIDSFTANNEGKLPFSLYQVGFGGRLDPWGTPYCYLNYGAGTGDGLQWALDAGIVDPGAFGSTESERGDDEGGGGSGGGSGGGGGGGLLGPILSTGSIAGGLVPMEASFARSPQGLLPDKLSVSQARSTVDSLATKIGGNLSALETESLVRTLMEVGDFDIFTGVNTSSTRRRDRYLLPLNTDYDLFSLGPNAATAVSLGDKVAQDDVIRANNGAFYGPASSY